MRRIKTIVTFSFLLLISASITLYPSEVKGACGNFLVDNGDTWTYSFTGGGTNAQTAFKITTCSGNTLEGDKYEIGSDDEHEETHNENMASSYVKYAGDMSTGSYSASNADSTETKSYGGRSISCRIFYNVASTDVLIIEAATGIVVERETDGKTLMVISWEYLTARGGALPGYDLPLLLGITAIFSIGVIFYIRKKQI